MKINCHTNAIANEKQQNNNLNIHVVLNFYQKNISTILKYTQFGNSDSDRIHKLYGSMAF